MTQINLRIQYFPISLFNEAMLDGDFSSTLGYSVTALHILPQVETNSSTIRVSMSPVSLHTTSMKITIRHIIKTCQFHNFLLTVSLVFCCHIITVGININSLLVTSIIYLSLKQSATYWSASIFLHFSTFSASSKRHTRNIIELFTI